MYYSNKNNRGFIRGALIVIIAVIAISFFVDIKSIVDSKLDSQRFKNNFQYLKTLSVSVWNKIFKK